MSFWKKLFGGATDKPSDPAAPALAAEHNGFHIAAMPYPEAGQFQVAGVIRKEIDGIAKEHKFVRADRFPTREDAAEFSLAKARQIIDQQGDRVFD